MRRGLKLIIAGGVLAGVIIALLALSGGSSYRVAAIFDNTNGLVAGQQVRIAGVAVGSVREVHLTSDLKARVVFSVDRRFAPFRADASCSILPESLISEDFLECSPGSSRAVLPTQSGLPTVTVSHTTVPLSLQDLLNVMAAPTPDQLRLLINELGIGTAGEGENLNSILLRSLPAITQTRRVLGVLAQQRTQVAAAVGQTNTVLASLAARSESVRSFVRNVAVSTETLDAHSAALSAGIQHLPAMLSETRSGLNSIDTAATQLTPLLANLQAAAPSLDSVTRDLTTFSRSGIPAVKSVARAARVGLPAVRQARPITHLLRAATPQLTAAAPQARGLLQSLRDTGGLEGAIRLAYALAADEGLYDNVGHMLAALINVAPQCIVSEKLAETVAGCSQNFSSPGFDEPVNEPGCGNVDPSWQNVKCQPATSFGPDSEFLGNSSALTTLRGLVNQIFNPKTRGILSGLQLTQLRSALGRVLGRLPLERASADSHGAHTPSMQSASESSTARTETPTASAPTRSAPPAPAAHGSSPSPSPSLPVPSTNSLNQLLNYLLK